MTDSADLEPMQLPGQAVWSALGLRLGTELPGGYQSRVISAYYEGNPVIAKLVDGRLADRELLLRRLALLAELSSAHGAVVGPIAIAHRHLHTLDGWLVAIFPYIEGRAPDVTLESDVRAMAGELAQLHKSLARFDAKELPGIPGLPAASDDTRFGPSQLLHGDFSPANLILSDTQMRVIDFDDCGQGPVEFEIAHTLYTTLFAAWASSEPDHYRQFREWFVPSYRDASGVDAPDELLDIAIDLRIQALRRWIDEPETAPIGIRTSSPEWKQRLMAFLEEHHGS